MPVSNKLEKMWEEVVVALSRNLPGGIEENHENIILDKPVPGRDLNPWHPQFEAGELITQLRRSALAWRIPEWPPYK